jgi:hypothetical protein
MFNFNFGKKKPDKKQIVLVSIALSVVIATLSQCSGAPQERLWDLLDEVQRVLFPGTIINDVLLQDPDVIEGRVRRDVDKAIRDYERLTGDTGEVRIPLPRLIERPLDTSKCYTEECRKLGGEMRLCAPFVEGLDDCKKD